jgi:hypothetical protein
MRHRLHHLLGRRRRSRPRRSRRTRQAAGLSEPARGCRRSSRVGCFDDCDKTYQGNAIPSRRGGIADGSSGATACAWAGWHCGRAARRQDSPRRIQRRARPRLCSCALPTLRTPHPAIRAGSCLNAGGEPYPVGRAFSLGERRDDMREMAQLRLPPLLVPRDCGEPVQILQQDAAALQVQNAVLAPGLELAVDAFARGADEHPELLLRDMHLGAEIGG